MFHNSRGWMGKNIYNMIEYYILFYIIHTIYLDMYFNICYMLYIIMNSIFLSFIFYFFPTPLYFSYCLAFTTTFLLLSISSIFKKDFTYKRYCAVHLNLKR